MALDPSIITSGIHQPEQIDPMGVLGKVMSLQNAQQQQQAGALALQEKQRQFSDQDKLRQTYRDAWTTDPNGVVTLNRQKLLSSLAERGLGDQIPAIAESLDKADKSTADVLKARAEADAAAKNAIGSLMAGVRAAGYTPGAFQSAADHVLQNKLADPQTVQQYLQAAQTGGQGAIQGITDGLIAESQKQTELDTAGKTAAARAQASATGAQRLTAEMPKITAETIRAQNQAAGTEPITPYQKAELARQGAANAETARHNKVSEAAANPFGAAGVTPAGTAASGQGVSGDEYLKTLPPGIASEVKAYAEGRRPFPTGMAMKAPYFQQMIQAVSQYDPSFDAVNFNGRNATRKDFTAGGSAKQITALNTVIGHLGDLSSKADALGNSDMQSYNTIKNWLKTQTGSADVTNFNTVRKGVTDELTRVWRQAGGSEQDIKTWGESLGSAQSPEQLTGAFKTIAGMLASRLDALENQKQQGLGKYGNDLQIVTPKSRTILDRLSGSGASAPMTKPIPGIPGAEATSTDGGKTWVRSK